MAKRKFTLQEVKALKRALNESLIIDGKARLPLEHAIHRNDLPLFEALLRLGADPEQTCQLAKDKHNKDVTVAKYLHLKVASEPLAYKQFINAYSDHKIRNAGKKASKNIIPIIGAIAAAGTMVFNVGMILKTFLPGQSVTSFVSSVLSNPVTTPIFGLAFNTAYLAYRSYKNFSNPAKSKSANLVAGGYDLVAFGLNSLAYASYFIAGASPVAGALFVAASAIEATRGVSKLVRAFRNRSQFKAKLNDPEYMANEIDATKAIRSYQRSNYKIATNVMRLGIAAILTVAVAVYCFMPLSLVATAGIFAGMGALYVASMIGTSIIDKFFKSRAKKQIAKYNENHTKEESADIEHVVASTYTNINYSLALNKDASEKNVNNKPDNSKQSSPPKNDPKKQSKGKIKAEKKSQKQKAVSLQSKTHHALTLFDDFQKKHTHDLQQTVPKVNNQDRNSALMC